MKRQITVSQKMQESKQVDTPRELKSQLSNVAAMVIEGHWDFSTGSKIRNVYNKANPGQAFPQDDAKIIASSQSWEEAKNSVENSEYYAMYKNAYTFNERTKQTAQDNDQIREQLKQNQYRPTAPPDGSFTIMFSNIGNGDCILIKTPGGKTIVVDCGSRSKPAQRDNYVQEIRDLLLSKEFLDINSTAKSDNDGQVYALILTHPDVDHYKNAGKHPTNPNKDTGVLCDSKRQNLKIRNIFYSMNKEKYMEYSTQQEVIGKAVVCFAKVTVNSDKKQIEPSNVEERYSKVETGIQILGKKGNDEVGERDNWDEENCQIYLLAAGVFDPEQSDEDKTKNTASIVTLIEVYGRKILLCGDATTLTEKFLLDKYKDHLKDIDLLHLAHHGSGTDHGSDNFVKTVNPKIVAISSGPHDGDCNPRWKTIEKYLGKQDDGKRLCREMDEHQIAYYSDGSGWNNLSDTTGETYDSYKKAGIYTTPSNGDLMFRITKDKELIREFCDSRKRYIYTIKADGKVSNKDENI